MSDRTRHALRTRLLAHLEGSLDESARETLEESVLADDAAFEALEAVETELIEEYIRGELAPDEEAIVARAIARSPRLSESAELVAALDARKELATLTHGAAAGKPSHGRGSRGTWLLAAALAVAALAWLHLQQRAELQTTQLQLQQLEEQSEAWEAERLRLEQELARAEAELKTRRQAE